MKTIRIILNGIELASVPVSRNVNTANATIAYTIPNNSAERTTIKINAGWAMVNDIM